MSLLKGHKENGIIQVGQKVNFTDIVQSSFFEPWGTQWYVDDEHGDDSYTGRGPSVAKATIQAAITAASEDDVIYVRPVGAVTDASDFDYYPEQLTIAYAQTNLSIIGVTKHFRNPYYGVWVRYGYTASDTGYVLTNSAPGLHMENIGFQTGDYIRTSYGAASMAATAYATSAGSVGFTIYNCFFRDGQLNVTGGYDSCTSNCTFKASGSANSGWWSTSTTLPTGGHQVINSHFGEMFADNQALRYIYCVAGAQKDMLFKGNTFGLVPADAHYMWFGGSNTGLVTDCYFQHAGVSTGTNDTSDELYSADGGIIFAAIYDGSTFIVT